MRMRKKDLSTVGADVPRTAVCRARTLQWSTADAEIKDPSIENPEKKSVPFKAWSKSEYNYASFTFCQEFPP